MKHNNAEWTANSNWKDYTPIGLISMGKRKNQYSIFLYDSGLVANRPWISSKRWPTDSMFYLIQLDIKNEKKI